MKHCSSIAAAGALLVFSMGQVSATVLLNDNFDGYADQTAFQTAWTPNTTTALLSTEQSVSANNSVKGLTTATRNLLTFGEAGTLTGTSDLVTFRFEFYDADATVNPFRQYAEIDDGTAPSASMQLVAMGLNNNLLNSAGAGPRYMARILGFDGGNGSGAFFKLDDPGAPARSTGWHLFEADISDTDIKFYVDGILSRTANTSALTDRSYDTVKVGSNLSSTTVAYFDDVHVERITVPEPASTSLAALGLAALWVGSRRSKKS